MDGGAGASVLRRMRRLAAVFPLRDGAGAPAAPAGPVSLTVHVVEPPPTMDAGLHASDVSATAGAGATVSVTLFVTPPYEAPMVTTVVVVTGWVRIPTRAASCPAGIVTLSGTDTASPPPLVRTSTTT